jgi:NADPH:quinone reductase-like Zn-dependent oxidoreductase
MKVVSIHSFGGPEVLQLEEQPTPTPAESEILIRVRAASVNPVDYKTRAGAYPMVKAESLPRVLGRDVAGKVEQCGARAQSWQVGDDVYAMVDPEHGGYAEYVALRANLCARAPNLTATEAAAVPLVGLTAWQGLFDHGQLHAGQSVLIHGGAGGVGHLAIQFAKSRGAHVATTVSQRDVDFARELGADIVIDYNSQRFEEMVSDVDLVLDLVGGDVQERSFKVLNRGGALISTLAKPDADKLRERNLRGLVFLAQPNGAQLSEIAQLIEAGKVRPYVHSTFKLEDVRRAHEAAERDHPRGKIVLEVSG